MGLNDFKTVNVSYVFPGLFLIGNMYVLGNAIWNYGLLPRIIVASAFCCGFFVAAFPRFLRWLLFVFGLSFFLYGFHPYSIYSQVFEFLITLFSVLFLVIGIRAKGCRHKNMTLILMIFLYVSLSMLSLLQLPLGTIFEAFRLWGFQKMASAAVHSWPDSSLYPLAAINRLVLFLSFALLLSRMNHSKQHYASLCRGILTGVILSAIIGLLDYYGVLSLLWYRDLDPVQNPRNILFRLQSTFGHPGWFAEFVTVAIPFVLMAFLKKDVSVYRKLILFVVLLVCEIALILAKARAGWISYPLTLVFCWVFFYLFDDREDSKRLNFSRKGILKVAISIPITIGISLLIILKILGGTSPSIDEARRKIQEVNALREEAKETSPVKDRRTEIVEALKTKLKNDTIASRTKRIFKASDRTSVWFKGILVGWEKPLFGMGYESFRWHYMILQNISESIVAKNQSEKRELDTPHNLFVQLFVSGGIVGLIFWFFCVAYTSVLLTADLMKNKEYFNLCVLLSLISFHIYGVFQSMQYIPVIWMLIFICFGYAMTIEEDVLPDWGRRLSGWALKVMFLFVLIGGVVYFLGRGSQDLAKKYGIEVYAADQDWHNYVGFYDREKVNDEYFRWSGKRGLIRIAGNGLVELNFNCRTPNLEREPLTVDIHIDGELNNQIVFETPGSKKCYCWLKDPTGNEVSNKRRSQGIHQILINVSRMWNPFEIGVNSDNRDLGIMVSGPRFVRKLPKGGVGFYRLEEITGKKPIIDGMKVARFRWTKKWASESIADSGLWIAEFKGSAGRKREGRGQKAKGRPQIIEGGRGSKEGGGLIFLKCSHPDIDKKPLAVEIFGDGIVLKRLVLKDLGWKKVEFEADEIKGKSIITYEVSRTWNPKRMGVSGDDRQLGVAVGVVSRQ
jgi:O-antigen ligase